MGLVLVFDMDQTLIDSSSLKDITDENFVAEVKNALNIDLINKVLKPAAEQRKRGKVDAIVMLTNNSDKVFAAWVSMLLADMLGSRSKYEPMYTNPELNVVYTNTKERKSLNSFFDYIMWREHSSRSDIEDTPKTIQDVKYMMEKLNLSTDNLEQRTYFFDDRMDHLIGADFDKFELDDHYIVIKSNRPELDTGFSKGAPDITDYTPIIKALSSRGGSRKMRHKKCKGGTRRRGGSKQFRGNTVTNLDEKFRGMDFFRKYGASISEVAICKILKKNPHPNIVKVYRITDSYIDIELLTPIITEKDYDKNTLISQAVLAKKHLQSLGIMYIDWKPDNIGIDADGKYKLFDFDLSGITTSNGKKWEVEPAPYSWSYRQAIANGLKGPKEIDDFAFEINFIRENYVALND